MNQNNGRFAKSPTFSFCYGIAALVLSVINIVIYFVHNHYLPLLLFGIMFFIAGVYCLYWGMHLRAKNNSSHSL